MTDKVQKIKEWISKEQDGLMDAQGNFENPEHEGAYHILCNLDAYIDSLQEEPEPQFKVGDIIRSKIWEKAVHEIVSMDDSAYFFENDGMIRFTDQEQWELAEESVSIWHNASEEPYDMSHCLIFYGCKESVGHYLHYEPVLYNKKEKVFVTSSFPHPTGYKVEQKSIDGGCVAEVYKNKRDRISISDITQWCYLKDLHNLSNVQRTGKNWKEPVNGDLEKVAEEAAVAAFFVSPQWTKTGERLFKAGAQWQKQQDSKLPKVWDRRTLDEYAYQVAYDLSNDWMRETPTWDDVETAVKLGAEWQKEKDQKK